ncbi:MAG: LacI family DNA-binding transcriptional regulator [Sarcina sp.]
MSITIKDVAKEASVAPSTVSRVLSNSTSISDETKRKVMRAVEKLNYKPNLLARSLVSKRRKMIGVVVPNDGNEIMSNNFFVSLMKGISLCAQKKGYYVSYTFSDDLEDDSKAIKDMSESGLVDGVCILRSKDNDLVVKELVQRKFPFVIIGKCNDIDDILSVDNDNYKISYKIVEEMLEKGNRKIAFLGAKENWSVSKERLKGYRLAFELNGFSVKENCILMGATYSQSVGYELAKKLYETQSDIESIFAADDLLAIGALEFLEEHNLYNVDIIGFNNIPLCEYQKRKLSTVDINSDKLGFSAAEILIDTLEGKEIIEKHRIVKCEIIKRETYK